MLADDEQSIRVLVERIVTDAGYTFCYAADGPEVFDIIARERPDLLLLDVMMPGMSGFTVCTQLRDKGYLLPIIIVSAKGDIVDKGVGFAAGADDYLVKPFSPEELTMRIQAHLRQLERLAQTQDHTLSVGPLVIDVRRHRISNNGREVVMTPKEFAILHFLMQCAGEIVTREQLIREVWGEDFVGETSSIAVFIRKIREKIEPDPSHPALLKTVRNVGYILG
jgi:two-component system response regulator VicR